MGGNGNGQLGDGTTTRRSIPTLIGSGFTNISAGLVHCLGTKIDGSLWAWGNNSNGQLGDSSIISRVVPTLIGSAYGSVAAGGSHSLALKADGSLWAWGSNTSGQLGDGSYPQQISPQLITVGPGLSVSLQGSSPGKIQSTPAGINCSSQTNNYIPYDCANGYADGTQVTLTASPSAESSFANWEGDCTGSGVCTVTMDAPKNVIARFARSSSSRFAKVAAGTYHSLALTQTGELWAWGAGYSGQLGDGSNSTRDTPVLIGPGYSAISAGDSHSVALKANGELWAWGGNSSGQLGDGTTTQRSMPTLIGTGYVAVATGSSYTLALKTDGSLWAWGFNFSGQLGDSTTTQRLVPTPIGVGYSAIAGGSAHSLALKSDGTLWAWGYNYDGRLGDGTSSQRLIPTLIGSGYSAITAGSSHSLALKTDGSLWAWGSNSSGQLGAGSVNSYSVPTLIGSGYSGISAGQSHSIALKTSGSLWTWGDNYYGQLGDGTTVASRNVPTFIGDGFSTLAAGPSHNLAVKADGSLVSWGLNNWNQLGLGLGSSGNRNIVSTVVSFRAPYTLSVVFAGNGSGGVVSAPTGLSCNSTCTQDFLGDTVITLTANAVAGSTFAGWSGACSGSGTCVVTMSQARDVTATFDQITFTTIITKNGSGSGTITSNPAGINCGADCSENFWFDAAVTLTATPAPGSVFAGWSVDCSGNSNCSLLTYMARNVTATFNTAPVAPAISFNPSSLIFADQIVGTTSPAKNSTLTNTGNSLLTISSIATTGDFAVSHNCGAALVANASCNLGITLTPTTMAGRIGVAKVTSNVSGSPHSIILSGTGITSNAPVCTLAANPARIQPKRSSVLTATCTPAATSYSWTGGTCAGTTASTCTVTPATTTTYSVTGTNGSGNTTASATVTIKTADLTPILMLLLD